MRAATFALALALAGCPQTEGQPLGDASRPADAAPADGPVDAAGLDAFPADVTGSWATRQIIATNVALPVVGPTKNRTITLYRHTVTANGGGAAVITQDVCAVRLESDSTLATNALRPGYIESLPDDTLTGTLGAGALTIAGEVDVRGCELANPATDPLPTVATDPRVRDSDADARPGITVLVDVTGLGHVDIYVVQRTLVDLALTARSADRLYGPVEVRTLEQNVIGATNSLFANTPATVVEPEGSRVTMVRVAPSLTCADVIAADEATLFGPR